MAEGKEHLSIVICGHVDSGKSTTTGHLLFELGGIGERELEKLKAEADRLGKSEVELCNIFIEGIAKVIKWEQALEEGKDIEEEIKAVMA